MSTENDKFFSLNDGASGNDYQLIYSLKNLKDKVADNSIPLYERLDYFEDIIDSEMY